MNDLIMIALITVSSIFGTGGIFLLLIFLNPEKIEKWGAFLGYCLNRIGGIFRFFHKRAVQLDLQGNINDYVKKVSKVIPTLETERVKVEYIDNNQNRESFINNNQVVLRLHREDPKDLNFVHGAFLFVSTSLLYKVKRYISQSQRDALDLYVTTKLIEKEKPQRVGYFLEEYLHPKMKDQESDRKKYFDKFAIIDEGGFFYPILIEELHSLGGKVFGDCKNDRIITEVRNLIDFLENFSQRKIGDEEVDLDFRGEYCKSSIVIIGRALNIVNHEKAPYLTFIRKGLNPKKIDNVYIVGNALNKNFINEICGEISDIYNIVRTSVSNISLHTNDGNIKLVKTYFVFLRRIDSSVVVVN